MKRACVLTLAFCLFGGFATPIRAYDLPAVNLGLTSFLDGPPPPTGPGPYFAKYLQYYETDVFNDGDGKQLPLPGVNLDVMVSAYQIIYMARQDLVSGVRGGLNVILPFVAPSLDYSAAGPFPEASGAGLGDILVGPFVQWDPVMGANGPVFAHRLELSLMFPTGRYGADREVNPGSNFVSFNPNWAATLFLGPQTTASWRLHYLWNGKNDRPNRGFGEVESSQAGQAFHANFAMARAVRAGRLRVGLNGYYLKQTTDTTADGNPVEGRREQVLGIGPGAVLHLSPDSHLFLNTYFETLVKNRTGGSRLLVRFAHHL